MSIGLGIGLSLRSQLVGGGFDPSTLFASGEEGIWLDPSDLTTMWTDTGATTQAGVGDAVARIDDKSGNGNHATQATVAARPILRQTGGGLYYLEFDGVDDILQTATVDLTGTSQVSAFCGITPQTNDTFQSIVAFGSNSNTTDGSFEIISPVSASAGVRVRHRGDTTAQLVEGLSGTVSGITRVVSLLSDLTSPEIEGRTNGSSLGTNTGTTGGGSFGSLTLTIGGRTHEPLYSPVDFYGLIIRGASSTSGEISDTEAYLADKSGVTL